MVSAFQGFGCINYQLSIKEFYHTAKVERQSFAHSKAKWYWSIWSFVAYKLRISLAVMNPIFCYVLHLTYGQITKSREAIDIFWEKLISKMQFNSIIWFSSCFLIQCLSPINRWFYIHIIKKKKNKHSLCWVLRL